jgi:lysophospholipase L1-like esterase
MLAVSASSGSSTSDQNNFELLDGDRVVFVGNTFIERDQVYGYLETMLTARWPDRSVTFRNLGWSGDTVWGEARARFGTAADGFQHLKEHIESIKPTVIVVGYGANESFDGQAGLPKFQKGLDSLLEMLSSAAAPKARTILLSPLWQENLGPPLPDPNEHNKDVRSYGNAIRQVAKQRDSRFVDLLSASQEPQQATTPLLLTENGIHLTAYGYWRAAIAIVRQLGVETSSWRVTVGETEKTTRCDGVQVTRVEKLPHGLRIQATAKYLPRPQRPSKSNEKLLRILEFRELDGRLGEITGIGAGDYEMRIDNEPVGIANAGVAFFEYESDRVERLRQAIIEKNRLYFHRWRPENETYLFGFRTHEQGQNADEVPKFDPLVEEQEKLIA